MEATGTTMTEFLGTLTSIAGSCLELVGDVITTVMENPILLFTTGIMFLGAAIGIFGRLLSRR